MEQPRPQIIKEPGDVPAAFVRMLGFAWEQAELAQMRTRAPAPDAEALAERDQRIAELEARLASQERSRMSPFSHRHSAIQGALNALARLDDEGDQAAELREGRKDMIRTALEQLLDDNRQTAPNPPEEPAEASKPHGTDAPPITLASRKAGA